MALDNYLTSLNLSFFICRLGIIIPTLWDCCSLECLVQCQVYNKCSNNSNCCLFGAFPGGSGVKNLPANAGDSGSIPESGRSPGEGNGNPLQYSFLENSMDRGAWWATVPGITKSRNLRLNNNNLCCRMKARDIT